MQAQKVTRIGGRERPPVPVARYIYAVVQGPAEPLRDLSGIDGHPVYITAVRGVGAVASDIEHRRIRPERQNLAAHRAVLARLVETQDGVLPMRFGLTAPGPEQVTRLLSRNHDLFVRQLQRLAGKVEMGLRVVWDVPNIFEYFVNLRPELKQMRDAVFGGAGGPTRDDRIELGRQFAAALDRERSLRTRTVEQTLAPRCVEIKRNPVREDREVMNLACLVERNRRDQFEEGVFEAARCFDNSFAFDYNGPWAPHAFADLTLRS